MLVVGIATYLGAVVLLDRGEGDVEAINNPFNQLALWS